MKPHIFIISPALANANNGNWQTARRWAHALRKRYRVSLLPSSDAFPELQKPDMVIALHARRSASALAAAATAFPDVPRVLVFTGTDLYRDIQDDADAQRSIDLATRMVILQEAGYEVLEPSLHERTTVIYQSAPSLKPAKSGMNKRVPCFNVCMIGHLRQEKDPATFMHAARLVISPLVRFTHIGSGGLDSALKAMAEQTQTTVPRYRWLGARPHGETRQRLKRSQLLVLSSLMEGGANVIIEAVTCDVPVLASDISGNRGMLGQQYAGYFPVGDSRRLAELIEQAANDRAFYARLVAQCRERAPLFSPEREQHEVMRLVENLLPALQ